MDFPFPLYKNPFTLISFLMFSPFILTFPLLPLEKNVRTQTNTNNALRKVQKAPTLTKLKEPFKNCSDSSPADHTSV